MITVYHVQTFYGTHQKTFQSIYHAVEYYRKLSEICECLDPISKEEVTEEEFVYMDIED